MSSLKQIVFCVAYHVIYALTHAVLMVVMDDGGDDDGKDVVMCPRNC